MNQRMIESDQKTTLQRNQKADKSSQNKPNKWKQDSENFRAILKAARKGETVENTVKDDRAQ